jgi:hypothetical protein
MASHAKIVSGEAEPAGFGGPKVKGKNEAWRDVRRHPKGRGHPNIANRL